jgi:beta-glucanase (GH16 family)
MALAAVHPLLPGAETADDPSYRLVWADEFDKDGPPDAASWEPEKGFLRNHELQWYQAANAHCKNGILTIEARREAVENPDHIPDSKDWKRKRRHSEFTSASLTTSGKHAWRYGRFEMRGRIPVAQGTWPAFWTLGSAREWPGCGEVDVMEAYKGQLLANLVWGSGKRWVGRWDTAKVPLADLGAGWEKDFHTWRMDWTAQRIVVSVDGRMVNESNLDERKNPDGTEPFREPHYLLLNLAIGGDAAGDPGGTEFPQRLEIDWVRVYEKKAP